MAEPIDFRYSNSVLRPPERQKYSEDIESIVDLPIWSNGEQCVSCWRPSIRERLSILFFGRIWLAVLSGKTQPSVAIAGSKEYLGEKE